MFVEEGRRLASDEAEGRRRRAAETANSSSNTHSTTAIISVTGSGLGDTPPPRLRLVGCEPPPLLHEHEQRLRLGVYRVQGFGTNKPVKARNS